MDRTSNQYNFPMYFQQVYGGSGLEDLDPGITQLDTGPLPEDLTLAEYTICHNMKQQLTNLVKDIIAFCDLQLQPFTQIETELLTYTDTSSEDDPEFFDHLLEFMAGHANEFIIQIGEGFSISPSYVHNLKSMVIVNEYLSDSILFKELLDIEDPEELYLNVSLSKRFITRMHTSLMASVVEKLAANFRGSEFVVGFNLCIIESNSETYGLPAKVAAANEMADYLVENCTHCATDATELIEFMEEELVLNGWFLETGEIDYDGFIFGDLTEAQETRIRTVKRYAKRIIGNSITEIRTKTNLNKLLMTNVSFPTGTG